MPCPTMWWGATYDGTHPNWPFFFWSDLDPGTSGFQVPTLPSGYTAPSTTVAQNAFVGYCPQSFGGYQFMNYRSTLSATEAFSQLNQDFSFNAPVLSTPTKANTPAYSHQTHAGLTRQAVTVGGVNYLTVGAEDQ